MIKKAHKAYSDAFARNFPKLAPYAVPVFISMGVCGYLQNQFQQDEIERLESKITTLETACDNTMHHIVHTDIPSSQPTL